MNIRNSRTLSEYGMCSYIKVASDTWYIAGTESTYILLVLGGESDTITTTTRAGS
jgi:hypothetical protein